jgi:hypothetical protein
LAFSTAIAVRAQPAGVIDNLDILMVLGPVISHEQLRASSLCSDTVSSAEETASDLKVKCSPQQHGARHPGSGFASSRPAGARSAARPPGHEAESADPPAATGTEPAKETRQMQIMGLLNQEW